ADAQLVRGASTRQAPVAGRANLLRVRPPAAQPDRRAGGSLSGAAAWAGGLTRGIQEIGQAHAEPALLPILFDGPPVTHAALVFEPAAGLGIQRVRIVERWTRHGGTPSTMWKLHHDKPA